MHDHKTSNNYNSKNKTENSKKTNILVICFLHRSEIYELDLSNFPLKLKTWAYSSGF